jgi:GT2 family glycosyltransferase
MPLNPDTIVYSGTIDRLLGELEADDTVAITVPVLKGDVANPRQYLFYRRFFDSPLMRRLTGWFGVSGGLSIAEPFEAAFFSGTGYICRRSAVGANRIFREDTFLFGEEYYLCKSVREAGYKIRVVPDAEIEHFTSVTFKSDPRRLAVASRLGAAIGWRIRNEEWGTFAGTAASSWLYLEYVFKLAAVWVMRLFRRSDSLDRQAAQAKAVLGTYFPLLRDPEALLKRVNEDAETFFNDGVKPVKPPISREVVPGAQPRSANNE